MLVSTALVLLMTPALGFFYGGLVRSKNALNTLMMSVAALGFVGVTWAVLGYSLAFAPGGASSATSPACSSGRRSRAAGDDPPPALHGVPGNVRHHHGGPDLRGRGRADALQRLLAFLTLWAPLHLCAGGAWVWGGGWLAKMGALDFAGGTVVHVNAGAAALVAALVLGPRKDYGRQALLPHNVAFTVLGPGLLWFGWFGFNAGSALAANASASLAFTNTMLAPAATLVMWTLIDFFADRQGHRSGRSDRNRGGAGGHHARRRVRRTHGRPLRWVAWPRSRAYYALLWRARTRLDDSLDVVAAHGSRRNGGARCSPACSRARHGTEPWTACCTATPDSSGPRPSRSWPRWRTARWAH